MDAAGNLYFADTWNQRVRMIAHTGTVSTVAGNGVAGDAGDGGAAVSANLLWPAGVAVDAGGNLYISSGSRVRRVSPSGTIAAFAGTATAGYGGDGGAATSARLTEPHGLAVDSAGNVYIADSGNFRIRKVAPNGTITTIAGTGVAGYSGDGGPAASAQIGYVHALTLDSAGNLYFSDPYNHCVRKVLTNGTVLTVAGGAFGGSGDGGPAVQAGLRYPYGLAADSSGNVYIADLLNQRVRVLATDGTIFTAAGNDVAGFNGDGQPGPYTSLNMPAELALAPGGGVYIADLRNFRIRELVAIQLPPVLVTPADGATGVSATPTLSWDAAGGATSYDVYFGSSPQPPLAATTAGTSYAPGTLAPGTVYFWEVVAKSGNGSAVSVLWSFTTQGTPLAAPVLSSPANAATGVSSAPTLTWGASAGAASYDVYFGTSPAPPFAANTAGTAYSTGTLTSETTYYWQVVARNGAEAAGSATWSFTTGAPAGGLRFVPITPCRVADTRNAPGLFGGPTMTGDSTRSFPIPQASCGIPTTAQAYSLNVTVVPKGYLGYLSLWPAGQTRPVVSTLNSWDGNVVANAAIVPAGADGAVSVYVTNPSDVILDINGYFDTSDSYAFYPATPCRVADTRQPVSQFGGPSMVGGQTRDFPIPLSSCDIPASAQAYALNVTVVPEGYLGFLTAWPAGVARPNASTLNSWTGKVVANAALVPTGNNESISVFVTNPTDVILDVNGYFGVAAGAGALSFYPVTPCRVADTRGAEGPFGGPEMEGGATRSFAIPASGCNIPSTAAAYSLNVTVVPDGYLGYLSAWPAGAAKPTVSTLNSWDGTVVANAAILSAGTNGAVSVFVTNSAQVVLDINGYFAR